MERQKKKRQKGKMGNKEKEIEKNRFAWRDTDWTRKIHLKCGIICCLQEEGLGGQKQS